MTGGTTEGRPKLLFALAAGLACVCVLKGADFWLGLSSARAAQEAAPAPQDAAATPAPPASADVPEDQHQLTPAMRNALNPGADVPGELTTDFDAPPEQQQQEPDDAERRILESLGERRAALDAREKQLDTRDKLLQAAELRIDQRIADLKALEAKVTRLIGVRDAAEEAQLAELVKTYSSMKAKDAAPILDGLDLDIVLDVMSRMKARTSAAILADMKPERARQVTEALARTPRAPAPAQDGTAG